MYLRDKIQQLPVSASPRLHRSLIVALIARARANHPPLQPCLSCRSPSRLHFSPLRACLAAQSSTDEAPMIVSLPDELLLHVARLLIDKNFVPSALRLRQASRALHGPYILPLVPQSLAVCAGAHGAESARICAAASARFAHE